MSIFNPINHFIMDMRKDQKAVKSFCFGITIFIFTMMCFAGIGKVQFAIYTSLFVFSSFYLYCCLVYFVTKGVSNGSR